MNRPVIALSRSAVETLRLGKRLGKALPGAGVLLLEGDLGAGKTTLAKGVAASQGVPSGEVTSPTFVLINEYDGRSRKVYHIDWYRLERVEGNDLDLSEECFADEAALSIVEWPQRGRSLLPREYVRVKLKHQGGDRRRVEISGRGGFYERWSENWRKRGRS